MVVSAHAARSMSVICSYRAIEVNRGHSSGVVQRRIRTVLVKVLLITSFLVREPLHHSVVIPLHPRSQSLEGFSRASASFVLRGTDSKQVHTGYTS